MGDEVSLDAWLVKVGRSSRRIPVEVCRRERASEVTTKVTEATFTVVAIGDDRRPRVPPGAAGRSA